MRAALEEEMEDEGVYGIQTVAAHDILHLNTGGGLRISEHTPEWINGCG